uniref:30S ribosomal protein S21 n=1 Tax=Macrostomum lignano TaxID=282301 RepID=A0A1I8JN85_9PLAT
MHVYDNEILPNTTFRLDAGEARELTDNLAQMLNERGLQLHRHAPSKADRPATGSRRKLCYVRHGFEKEMRQDTPPASRSLKKRLQAARRSGDQPSQTSAFRCAEPCSQPSSFKMGKSRIQQDSK